MFKTINKINNSYNNVYLPDSIRQIHIDKLPVYIINTNEEYNFYNYFRINNISFNKKFIYKDIIEDLLSIGGFSLVQLSILFGIKLTEKNIIGLSKYKVDKETNIYNDIKTVDTEFLLLDNDEKKYNINDVKISNYIMSRINSKNLDSILSVYDLTREIFVNTDIDYIKDTNIVAHNFSINEEDGYDFSIYNIKNNLPPEIDLLTNAEYYSLLENSNNYYYELLLVGNGKLNNNKQMELQNDIKPLAIIAYEKVPIGSIVNFSYKSLNLYGTIVMYNDDGTYCISDISNYLRNIQHTDIISIGTE